MYKNKKSAWTDVQLFQNWFFEEFVPCAQKFLRKRGRPEKALTTNEPRGNYIFQMKLLKESSRNFAEME